MNNVTFLARRGWSLYCQVRTRVVVGIFDGIRFYQETLPGSVYPSWEFWKEGLLLDGIGDTVSKDYECLSPYLSRQDLLFELPVARRYDMYELEDMWTNQSQERMYRKWKK